MANRIAFIKELCTNCSLCAMYCALTFSPHGNHQFRPYISRIRVRESDDGSLNAAHVCLQCADAACINSCPVEAIFRDKQTGVVCIDEDACIGCNNCVEDCPYRCIFLVDGRAIKCEVCDDPPCVKACAVKALKKVENDDTTLTAQEKLYREVR